MPWSGPPKCEDVLSDYMSDLKESQHLERQIKVEDGGSILFLYDSDSHSMTTFVIIGSEEGKKLFESDGQVVDGTCTFTGHQGWYKERKNFPRMVEQE